MRFINIFATVLALGLSLFGMVSIQLRLNSLLDFNQVNINQRQSLMRIPKSNVTFFQTHESEFIEVLVECIRDEHCQIFFHHVQKAAGTYIGSRLFPWLNNNFPNAMLQEFHEECSRRRIPVPPKAALEFQPGTWCCYERIMRFARRAPHLFCRYKFSSWEISARQMAEVVDICFFRDPSLQTFQTLEPSRNKAKPIYTSFNYKRAVVLATFRDPVERFTSMVHQLCNEGKDFSKFTGMQILTGNWNSLQFVKSPKSLKEIEEACHRCDYNAKGTSLHPVYANDSVIWDHVVRDSNHILRGVSELVSSINFKNRLSQQRDKRAQILVLDALNVTHLFDHIQKHFPDHNIPQGQLNGKRPYHNCQFPTETFPLLTKGLEPGQILYKNLTLGIVGRPHE